MLLFIVAAAALSRAGDTKPTAPQDNGSFAALKKSYDDAMKTYSDEFETAYEAAKSKGDAALKAFKFDKPRPGPAFSPKFLAVVEKDPEGPDAVPAIKLTIQSGYDKGEPMATSVKAVKISASTTPRGPRSATSSSWFSGATTTNPGSFSTTSSTTTPTAPSRPPPSSGCCATASSARSSSRR
jgi:hypothetical protein